MARKTAQKPKIDTDSTDAPADDAPSPANDPAPRNVDSGPDMQANLPEVDAAPPVEDAELLEMLEHLSKTIDTAQSVLDEQHRMVMDVSRPPLPHLPGMDAGPAPLSHLPGAERFDPAPAPAPEPPRSRSGLVISAATAVFSATLAIGLLGTWWLFLNKQGTSTTIAKDESRITSSVSIPKQLAALPTTQEPPLPNQNPLRQVVAEATAIPIQHAVEVAPAPDAPAKSKSIITRKLAPTPYEPLEVPQDSLIQTARNQTPLPGTSATSTPVPAADPVKPVPAQKVAPQDSTTAQQEPASAQGTVPEARVAQRSVASGTSTVVAKQPAVAQAQPAPAVPQASQQPASNPEQPVQIARGTPQEPVTSDNLKPREKLLKPLSKVEEQRILRRGADLSDLGDIAGARLVLEYAAMRGNAEAMFALGQTFDPDYLAERGVVGVAADADLAVKWYSKAAELGIDAASARARELESQVGQRR